MNILLQPPPFTPEDLLRMDGGPRYELVNGRLVEKGMGQESDLVAVNLITLLRAYSAAGRLGEVFGQGSGYQVFPHEPRRVRYPDVSFIRAERMPPGGPARGHCRVAPDLAVEVVSPNDEVEDLFERIDDFLRAGTPLFWEIAPATRTVHILHADGTGGWRREGQDLSGEPVLPGFACRVADLFVGIRPRPVVAAPPE